MLKVCKVQTVKPIASIHQSMARSICIRQLSGRMQIDFFSICLLLDRWRMDVTQPNPIQTVSTTTCNYRHVTFEVCNMFYQFFFSFLLFCVFSAAFTSQLICQTRLFWIYIYIFNILFIYLYGLGAAILLPCYISLFLSMYILMDTTFPI